MKILIITLLVLITSVIPPNLFAQNVSINATGNLPDTSAMLDVSSTNKGFLLPRMTTGQQNAIVLPATGLAIFNTTLNSIMINTGTSLSPIWSPLSAGSIDTSSIANFSSKVRGLFSSTTPVTYSNGLIGVTQATTSTNGYLSSADWNTFNSKGGGSVTNVTATVPLSITGTSSLTPNVAADTSKSAGKLATFSDVALKQNQLNGTGFVKATGTTITYDNSTYLTSIDTSNIAGFSSKVRSLFSSTAPITYSNGLIGITQATTSTNGYLSSIDWNTFNNKAASYTSGNLTETGSGVLTITGGTGSVIGTGTTVQVKQANTTTNGFLSSSDWNTFNNKLSTIDTTNIGSFSTKVRSLFSSTAPVTYSNGSIGITQATTSTNGYLSSTDWNTFNSKGGGSVTSVSVTSANGVSGTVATATTTPAITLTLGNITPTSVAATGTVAGSNLSGTNTGDQTITLTSDVTGSGTGSFATTIGANKVTYAKMQAVSSTSKLLGSSSTTTPVQEITLGTGLSLTGTTLTATGSGGTVTSVGLSLPSIFTVSNSPVTASGTLTGTFNTQTANLIFGGPSSGIAAAPAFRSLVAADLPLATTTTVGGVSVGTGLSVTAGVLSAITQTATGTAGGDLTGTYPNPTIANGVVSNARLATMPALTIKGNNTGTTTNAADLTVAQVNAILPVFTSTFNGLVPFSGGSTGKVLHGDGTWRDTASATNQWSLTGNTGTSYLTNFLGTTDNTSLRFRTFNTQAMILDSLGNVAIGTSPTFSTTNPEKLLVDAGTGSYNVISGKGNLNNFLQLNIKNSNTGSSASSDVVATNDAGTEANGINYVDMGVNSSGYSSGGVLGGANNAYLYATGNDFIVGNSTASMALRFFTTNASATSNEAMRIDPNGNLGIGTTTPSSKLHVVGTNPLTLIGVATGTNTTADSLLTITSGLVRKLPVSTFTTAANSWNITGNIGTTSGANFIGTADNHSLSFSTNSMQRMYIDSATGNVGVGTNTPGSNFTVFQQSGSGATKGVRFTGNSLGGTSSGTGFLMTLGYNAAANKQLWLGDPDYAGNPAGTFVRYTVSSVGSASIDAVAGDGSIRRSLELGVGGDANASIILGADGNETVPGSFVWDYNNMAIGNGYRANAAPANGLIVQGSTGIGTTSFNATYPEKILVDAGTSGNTNYQNVVVGKGNTNSYAQLNIQNGNAGTNASSDVVATADNGNESANYIDMGINSSSNTSTGVLGGINTAYLYGTGNDFSIGNSTSGKSLLFFSTGSTGSNECMRIDSAGRIGIGNTAPAYKLDVIGTGSFAGTNPLLLSGVQAGATTDSVLTITGGVVKKLSFSTVTSAAFPIPYVYSLNTSLGIGTKSLLASSTGIYNVAYGDSTLSSNTTGVANTGIGRGALLANTTGSFNTAIGAGSLSSNTTGIENTAIGLSSLRYNTTGIYNTATGLNSLSSNTTGSYNIAAGVNSLITNTTGSYNIAIGVVSLNANTTGYQNTAIGDSSLFLNITGYNNSSYGHASLYNNKTGINNTATGYQSLYGNTTGYSNTAAGVQTLFANTTGYQNTAVGDSALYSNTTGYYNSSLGYASLYNNKTGINNTATGYQSLYSNTTGNYNSSLGYASLYNNTTGVSNTATGHQSLYANTSGNNNAASGYRSLYSNTTGYSNTAVGVQSLSTSTTGNQNTAIGDSALYSNTTGTGNTAIGYNAGYSDGTTTTGVALTNATAIGYYAQVTASNSLVLGGTGSYGVNVGIGVTNPAYKLSVAGIVAPSADNTYSLGGSTSNRWSAVYATNGTIQTSDRRLKTNIKTLNYGLKEVLALQPVSYNWKEKPTTDNKIGLIAQDVKKVVPEVVTGDETKEKLGMNYGELVPVLINAIKEQQAEIESLKKDIQLLKDKK